ncbi:hypothetical protein CHARACLAT_022715 [Characodon lateralis]|uniref:Uncharacterized protein n=1 Tax=Characodon lateralis TaxID=208331 RepID=A0ABU7DJ25_9TELE|nr:hypothetical protein [Characodon lateralis]
MHRCRSSVIKKSLKRSGVPEEDASKFSLSVCVFFGFQLDDSPVSDSRRTYLRSSSEVPLPLWIRNTSLTNATRWL